MRRVLQLEGLGYSPCVLNKIVQTAGRTKSFEEAAEVLQINAEFLISGRYVNQLTAKIGKELEEIRDQQTEDYIHHRRPSLHGAAPLKVMAAVDGGRINTRQPGEGPGVHDPGWRENKTGCLQILEGPTFSEDPHPQPPKCFLDPEHVQQMVKDFQQQKGLREYDEAEATGNAAVEELPIHREMLNPRDHPVTAGCSGADAGKKPDPPWPPERVQRSCLSSLANSHEFGKMLAAQAYGRHFFEAMERAFLGDGLAYNWTMQEKWFPTFVAILDFIHPLSYLFASAGVVRATGGEHWQLYVDWMSGCWQGRVDEVIQTLRAEQDTLHQRLGEPDGKMKATDPREVIRKTLHYLENNRARMDYPEYRKRGLPVTSSAVESLIKEFNHRVKGSEKFWNDPEGAEAILQVRAAILSEDNRLEEHILQRPGNPYRRTRKSEDKQATVAA